MERNSCERVKGSTRVSFLRGIGSVREAKEMHNRSPMPKGRCAASLTMSNSGFSHRSFAALSLRIKVLMGPATSLKLFRRLNRKSRNKRESREEVSPEESSEIREVEERRKKKMRF